MIGTVSKNMWRTGGRLNFPIDGLVLYAPLWHPELQGATFKSKDLNAHVLTPTGTTWGTQGRTFDGNDYIELVGDTSILNFTTGAYSIIAHIYITDFTSDRYIFIRGAYNADGYNLQAEVAGSGRLLAWTAQAGAAQISQSANSSILVNTHYIVALVRSGASIKFYINGIESVGTAGSHTNPLTSARTVKIGIYDDKALNGFVGIMGEVAVFSHALNANENLHIYQANRWRYS